MNYRWCHCYVAGIYTGNNTYVQTCMFQAGLTAKKSSPTKLTGCYPSEIMQWRSPSIVKYKSLLSTQWWSNINNSLPSTPSGALKSTTCILTSYYLYLIMPCMAYMYIHSRTQFLRHFTKHGTSEINHILKPSALPIHPPLLVPGSPLHPTTPSCHARCTFYPY